jgi:hypothetical protein
MKKSEVELPVSLPVKVDSTSNGEYWPTELSSALREVNRSALEAALLNAKRLGLCRREYLQSTCAAATVFLGLNQLGCAGGRYNVAKEAALEPAAADAALSGDEFIFDVQTHQVSADRTWWKRKGPSLANFLHLGEDRILWGTDAIWYGSPQDQIQAFRAFEITAEFQERFGYPALTPAVKRKIFGLTGAKVYGVDVEELQRAQRADSVSSVRAHYAEAPSPSHRTYGPTTRREMFSFLRQTVGGH